ncbi:aquaporin [Hymenobacter sp. BT664]|uniref:Aquaporin n=1 Tax=Hymenobacter montanus TaxID=2771359 RepID=A0A927B9H4_9BACT|nr:aquaporin [Hymenobacter montanus]MBD2766581.1 aquaporin [Hymenobacter montanus]
MKQQLRPCLVAEALGTAMLVAFGTGAAVVNEQTHALGHGGVAAAFGLVIIIVIQSVGSVSGAHINPAVTLAFWAAGRFPGQRVLPYLGAQFAGALAGSGLVSLLATGDSTLGATLPAHSPSQALGIEVILTFWLMFVILRVTAGSKEEGLLAGVAIGATVGLDALVGGPLTGGSMNPARSLAPALLSGHLSTVWVYMVGPVAGALLAVVVNRLLQSSTSPASSACS